MSILYALMVCIHYITIIRYAIAPRAQSQAKKITVWAIKVRFLPTIIFNSSLLVLLNTARFVNVALSRSIYLPKNSNYQLWVNGFPSKSRIEWAYVSYARDIFIDGDLPKKNEEKIWTTLHHCHVYCSALKRNDGDGRVVSFLSLVLFAALCSASERRYCWTGLCWRLFTGLRNQWLPRVICVYFFILTQFFCCIQTHFICEAIGVYKCACISETC